MNKLRILYSLFLTLSYPLLAVQPESLSQVVVDKNPLKILTPSLKDVKFKKLILSNGVKVFIISDKEARQSSAALAVNVGSWNNPEEYLGMAHFCEHMLFMGSKKYPDENAYWKCILDNGGTTNAYTSTDRTVYMFAINHDQFDKSLDMFSRFFIDPLFSESCINRELLAVNQEHNKNIEHDGWRSWFIFKQEGNQNHPNAAFSTGTEDTLKIVGRDNLVKWYKENYKSSGMHLVVYSNQDIDSLTTLVEDKFSQIEASKDAPKPYPDLKITSPNQEGHITYIEPVKDLKELTITWEIPPAYANDLDRKSYKLIAYSLAHHMKGGLYSLLKEQGLIENFSADTDKVSGSHLLLSFNMNLTSEGIQKTDHILYTFFSALNKLKSGNVPLHIYNDMETVLSTSYQWQSRKDPFKLTMELVDMMVDEPLETFPYKTVMINQFDQKNSRDLLSYLTARNAIFTITGSKEATHRNANKVEPWTGAKYSLSKVNEEVLEGWEIAEPSKDISLPNPNPYISKHQKLLNEEVNFEIKTPNLIADDAAGKCYFLQDTLFLEPKTQLFIRIKSPEITSSKKSICLNKMFCSYLYTHMSSLIAEGAFAGIETSIYPKELGLNIVVNGYHDKIGSYMMSFLSNLITSYPTKNEFDMIKNELLSNCKSLAQNLPSSQGMNLLYSIISNVNLDMHTEASVLQSITLEDLQTFQKRLLEENYLQTYISGNIDKESAMLYFSEMKSTLSAKPYEVSLHDIEEYVAFYGDTPEPKKISIETKMGGNSAILLIDQDNFTDEKYASQSIFASIIREAFFGELRTKQQTGYIVQSAATELHGRLLQFYIAQSTTHYPEELLARYELFLENYSRDIKETITEERFNNVKASIISKLTQSDPNLISSANRNFSLAYSYNGDFDRSKKQITALTTLSYDSFITNAKQFMTRDNPKRLAILVKGSKVDKKSFSYTETSAEEIATIRK